MNWRAFWSGLLGFFAGLSALLLAGQAFSQYLPDSLFFQFDAATASFVPVVRKHDSYTETLISGVQGLWVDSAKQTCLGKAVDGRALFSFTTDPVDATPTVKFYKQSTSGESVTAKKFVTSTASIYYYAAADFDAEGFVRLGAEGVRESVDAVTGVKTMERVKRRVGGVDVLENLGTIRPQRP